MKPVSPPTAFTYGDFAQRTYDDYGRVIQQTYEDGATVTYDYDNNGYLARVTGLQPSSIPYGGTEWVISYCYDLTGRMVKIDLETILLYTLVKESSFLKGAFDAQNEHLP